MILNFERKPEHIHGNRRRNRRYPVTFRVHYQAAAGTGTVAGEGVTLDMSSGGVAFLAGQPLPATSVMELSIEWPVTAGSGRRLVLAACGRVVRRNGLIICVRVSRYEFRQAATPAEGHRTAMHLCDVVTLS